MRKLKTLLASCALILALNTPVMSDSSNFAGPYIGLQGSTVGVGVQGSQVSNNDATSGGALQAATGSKSYQANVGKTGITAGLEAGYAIPVGSMFLLDIGGSYIDGAVSLASNSNNADSSENVKFVVQQFYTMYAAPTLVLSDTSSLYAKFGYQEASVNVTGDVTNPGDLQGNTYAIGTRTVLDSGIFVRAEAGYIDYDNLEAQGKGNNVTTAGKTSGIATTTKFKADPELAYGAISIGFRF
jgi:hypothetical protein